MRLGEEFWERYSASLTEGKCSQELLETQHRSQNTGDFCDF